MGAMKTIRTAETNGYEISPAIRAHIRAEKAEQRLKAWQRESGPPEPPQANTGFYRCDGAYHWVGTGPWPDYRPPGIVWDRGWKQKKPADIPWRDEAQPKPYTVDDVWREEGPAIRAEIAATAPPDTTGYENAFGPALKSRRKQTKTRDDGSSQGLLF